MSFEAATRADAGPGGGATGAATLDAILARAVAHDPRLAEADARAAASAAAVGTARARLLPRLSATAGYTRNEVAAEIDVPGEDEPVVITARDQLDATLRLDVPLVDAAAWAAVSAATACRDAAAEDADSAARAALLDAVRAAWSVATAERAREAADAAVSAHEAALARAAARKDAGVGPNLDVLRAAGDLARARGTRATAEADLAAARRDLAARTGLDALPGPLGPRAAPPGDLADGARARPEVTSARATVACRSRTAAAARLGALPSVSGFAQERITNATGFAGQAATWAAGATLNWTPMEGGRRVAAIAEAEANLRVAEAALGRREQEARDAVADAAARLAAAEAARDAARARDAAAAAASADARARFDAGTGLAVEVSLAVDEALAARTALARAEADAAIAIEALRVAAGRPLLLAEAP